MREVGQYAKKGIVRNVLQKIETGGATIWFEYLGPTGGNRDNGGRYSYWLFEKNYGKVIAVEGKGELVYSSIRGSEVRGGSSVYYNLHRKNTGDTGIVGVSSAGI